MEITCGFLYKICDEPPAGKLSQRELAGASNAYLLDKEHRF